MMRPVDPSAGGVAGALADASIAPARRRGPGPTARIVIGLVLGVVIGWLWPTFAADLRPLADVFLRMIKMIIGPLLFSTLVVGIAGTGDLKAMGRIGAKALIYFEVATTFALVLGLGLVNLLRPGAGVATEAASVTELQAMAGRQQGAWDIVLHMFPTSLIDSLARNDVLQVVVFATFFGVALAATGEKGRPVATLLDAVAQVMFKVTGYVMWFAPIGVMAAVAATVGSKGLGILLTLEQAGRRDVPRLRAVPAADGRRRAAHRADSHRRVHPRRPRAGADRLHHRQQRGRPAQGARGDGAVRGAAHHRRVRAADRLQLQPRWLDVLPVDGQRLRRPDGRRRADVGAAADDAADADADQQGRRRRAARRRWSC